MDEPTEIGRAQMTKRFQNLPDLSAELAFDLIDRLCVKAGIFASLGASNQSCSRYVNVIVENDEGDVVNEIKVRFSDHDDRHGSDITLRIDEIATEIEDEDGDFVGFDVDEGEYEELLAQAEAAVFA